MYLKNPFYYKKNNNIIFHDICRVENVMNVFNKYMVMVFNSTFNNISVISWRPVLLVEETDVPGDNHRLAASHWQFYGIKFIEYTSPWVRFYLTILVVIGMITQVVVDTSTTMPNHHDSLFNEYKRWKCVKKKVVFERYNNNKKKTHVHWNLMKL